MHRPSALAAWFGLTAMLPSHAMEPAAFVALVQSSHPAVVWQPRRVLKADFTCRGRQELAVLGTKGPQAWIAVLASAHAPRPIVLEINSDLAVATLTLSVETQDFEVGDGAPGDVGPLPGFKRSKTCKGLKLDDDRIDSVHVYWNRIEERFQTWQR